MKNAIALAVGLSGGLFQVAQKPVLHATDPSVSLEDGCKSASDWQGGVATQGGYRFRYESAKGLNCRGYRLLNAPGQQSVKVKWRDTRDKAERLLCETKLPACAPSGLPCPFLCSQPGQALQDLQTTDLGYGGPNADSRTDRPPGYVLNTSAADLAPLRTGLQGIAADRDGRPLEIGVEVISTVSGKQAPYRLTYAIRTSVKSRPFSLWLPDGIPIPSQLVVRWSAIDTGEPVTLIRKQESFLLSADRPMVSLELSTNAFERSSKLLVVMQDNDRVAAVTAPAYVASR
jgi:hypothetical protein